MYSLKITQGKNPIRKNLALRTVKPKEKFPGNGAKFDLARRKAAK